ncbi:MAG: DnaD domain protein [Lachnospiraceae bacterium]|nr:DnaD domain protein [Lachnospiraceae bacterium]MBR4993992.1 DnaD domain protein [Lachnospiraceae bacterium]
MNQIKIYKDGEADYTSISNLFIDEYMAGANDAQIKIYLYLVRVMSSRLPTSVSDIADKFNYTEKDVLRALKYWEKNSILSLDFDENKTLTGIRMEDLINRRNKILTIVPKVAALPIPEVKESIVPEVPAKPAYSSDDLLDFKKSSAQLLWVVESYLGKPLTATEVKSIIYMSEELHFSDDLIDYLVQYCVEQGKKSFRYIETVAISWAEAGITTPKQAKRQAAKFDKSVYEIMNSLGKSGSPTNKEMEFINRWTKDYGFGNDVIIEACERTVLATDSHRFEYADGILGSWNTSGVRKKDDINALDEIYRKKRNTTRTVTSNKFTQYQQNSYDYDALEKELLSYQ